MNAFNFFFNLWTQVGCKLFLEHGAPRDAVRAICLWADQALKWGGYGVFQDVLGSILALHRIWNRSGMSTVIDYLTPEISTEIEASAAAISLSASATTMQNASGEGKMNHTGSKTRKKKGTSKEGTKEEDSAAESSATVMYAASDCKDDGEDEISLLMWAMVRPRLHAVLLALVKSGNNADKWKPIYRTALQGGTLHHHRILAMLAEMMEL